MVLDHTDDNGSLYKIAILCETMDCGGAEKFIIKLCKHLNRSLFSISVIVTVRDAPFGHQLLGKLRSVPDVKMFVSPYYKNDPRIVLWLNKLFKNYRFDLVHTFLARSDLIGAMVTRLNGFENFIISERGFRKNGINYGRGKLQRWLDRGIVFPVCKMAIANSEFAKRSLIAAGMDPVKIIVIPNGIEIDKSANARKKDNDQIQLCIVANLQSRKGHRYLLVSLSQLDKSCDWLLHIVGNGIEDEYIKGLAKDLSISHRIVFHGFLPDPVSVISQSDICLLTSIEEHESCSNSILEYMKEGKPTIGTTVSGIPELIDNNVNGILVSPKDTDALREAIRSLIDLPELRMSLGRSAMAKAQRYYSMETITKRYECVYLSLLNQNDQCKGVGR
jgi:glycosyltransferase involved in cell wall biosynthesis